jgi:hypothetical protein
MSWVALNRGSIVRLRPGGPTCSSPAREGRESRCNKVWQGPEDRHITALSAGPPGL